MLKINNLFVVAENQPLLTDINLSINSGEIHVVTGPVHSGKSALAHIITGHPSLVIESGNITFDRKKINKLSAQERSKRGIFIGFQNPPDFENFTNWELFENFIKASLQDIDKMQAGYLACCQMMGLTESHGDKINIDGPMLLSHFKYNEIVHMLMSDPKLIILDEIDDGLSENEVKLFANVVNEAIAINKCSALIITRNQLFLSLINPTHIHVMTSGKITMSGDGELCKRIVENGYSELS